MRRLAAIVILGFALNANMGCALLKHNGSSASGELEVVKVPAAPEANLSVVTGKDSSETTSSSNDSLIVDRKDLGEFKHVTFSLGYGDLTLVGNGTSKKGSLRVQRLKGDVTCRVNVIEKDDTLMVTDMSPAAVSTASLSATGKLMARSSIPKEIKCRYAIEYVTRHPAPLRVDLTRGSVTVEEWADPVHLKVDWGDIDVGSVGPLDVTCGRCTLAGENVNGALHFAVENGNVGLNGLTASVDGTTYGDTVLKWRKIKSDSAVKLVSKAGDVILTFPRGLPLDLKLKAPRGDVYTSDKDSASRGIPVTVTAEVGNVKLYSTSN